MTTNNKHNDRDIVAELNVDGVKRCTTSVHNQEVVGEETDGRGCDGKG